MKNNLAIYGGFNGTETSLNDRNPVTNVSILSGDIEGAGNADNSYNVVKNLNNGLNSTAIPDGFTITGGNANGGNIVPTSPLNCGGVCTTASLPLALPGVLFKIMLLSEVLAP